MRSVRNALFAILLIATAPIATPTTAQDARTDQFLDLIGMKAQFDSLALNGRAGILDSTRADARILEAFDQIFDPDRLYGHMRALMAGDLDGPTLDALFESFTDGIGAQATEMEKTSMRSAPDLVQAEGVAALTPLVETNAPRIALYEEMFEVLDTENLGVAVAMNVTFAMLSAMSASPEAQVRLDEAQIRDVLGQMSDGVRQQMRQQLYIRTAFTYRDMSDADLEAYLALLKEPHVRRFYDAAFTRLEQVIVEAAGAFGAEMARVMEERDL